MAAVLAKHAGAPVKLEFTRKEDFIAVHGRWPTSQYYKVGATRDGIVTTIQLRGYSGLGPYRKAHGDIAGFEAYQCPNVELTTYPVYTNMAVAGNFRAPAHPQSVFGLESVMDDLAYALKMDPLEFRLKNMTRKFGDEIPYTSNGLEDCIRRGGQAFEWNKRWHPPGDGPGPLKRGAGMGMGIFPSPLGRSSALIKIDSRGICHLYVGVTDSGTGAKTVMAMIASEELGIPLSKINVIWGDTALCPPSVGESGGRTTVFTGNAVIEAAREIKRQITEKGMPEGDNMLSAAATPQPVLRGATRFSFVAHFAEVEVDTETGHVRVTKFLSAHDSGRIVNPLTAASQVKGGSLQGISMALHEELRYDRGTGLPLTASYYGSRIMTHPDAPQVDVLFVEPDDGYPPYGAKTLGEPPLVPPVAAVANAIFNATGRRIRSLPITRARVLEALA
jgi:CO/xanthine dehydrogenase Mo-binding subunit